ncbi:MAG TPA: DNA-primase RepB domain-containing protein [Candidatus Acidoferrales bacterium]
MTNDNFPSLRMLSAAEFVLAIHRPEDRVAVLVRDRVRSQTIQRILTAESAASSSFQRWLADQNERGADVFLGMNPLKENSYSRTKEHIREIRCVYLDLDENAAESLRSIRTTGDVPKPNFVLDTSTEKSQVVWKVEGLEREQAESVLRSLAAHFRGDTAATDVSRVLRVPGFLNRKYNEHFVVRAIQEADQTYRLQDFAIYEDSPDAPRHLDDAHEPTKRLAPGHRSQSEADWAYAKRALARGDDAERVIQRIADYRSQDKADPIYYARHTVEKARADFQQRSASSTNAIRELTHQSQDDNLSQSSIEK